MNGIVVLIVLVAVIIFVSMLGYFFSKIRYEKYMNSNFIKFENTIVNTGFRIKKKTGVDYSWLYTDDVDRKFILYSGEPNAGTQILNYNDLIDFELLEDGKCIVSAKTADTVIDDWRISDACINLQLLIRINDSERSEHVLSLISPKTSIPRNDIYHIVKELIDDLLNILDHKKE